MITTANIFNVWNEEEQRYIGVPSIKGDKPIKGVDYWTENDRQSIVDDAIANMPSSNEMLLFADVEFDGFVIENTNPISETRDIYDRTAFVNLRADDGKCFTPIVLFSIFLASTGSGYNQTAIDDHISNLATYKNGRLYVRCTNYGYERMLVRRPTVLLIETESNAVGATNIPINSHFHTNVAILDKLTVSSNKLRYNGVDVLSKARANAIGAVKPDGSTIVVDENGTISATGAGTSYNLPIASNSVLGGIKIGDGLSINNDGALSVNGAGAVVKSKYVPNDWERGVIASADIYSSNDIACMTFEREIPDNAIVIDVRIKWLSDPTNPESFEDVSLSDLTPRGLVDFGSTTTISNGVWISSWGAFAYGGISGNVSGTVLSNAADYGVDGRAPGFTIYYLEVSQ